MSEELDRLEAAGLVTSDRRGNTRVIRVNQDSPYYPELRSLVLKAFGPVKVLEHHLRDIGQIKEAYLYGSWAARYLGESGEPPADVDLLVIGSPDVRDVRRAARAASEELGREVNPTVLSRDEWDAHSGFVRTVRQRPLVSLDLSRND